MILPAIVSSDGFEEFFLYVLGVRVMESTFFGYELIVLVECGLVEICIFLALI